MNTEFDIKTTIDKMSEEQCDELNIILSWAHTIWNSRIEFYHACLQHAQGFKALTSKFEDKRSPGWSDPKDITDTPWVKLIMWLEFWKIKWFDALVLQRKLFDLVGTVDKVLTKFCNISGLSLISQELCVGSQHLTAFGADLCVATVSFALTSAYQILIFIFQNNL